MTDDEKAVTDELQGRESYEEVLLRPELYDRGFGNGLNLITA